LDIKDRIIQKSKICLELLSPSANPSKLDVKVIVTENGQEISNFNNGRDFNKGSLLNPTTSATNPIVLVIPNSSKVISNSNYLTYATQGGVFWWIVQQVLI
jgi:hypothetical protein